MPKRKVEADDDDDEVEASHSEQEEEIKPKKAVKKPRSIKKPKTDSGEEEEAPKKFEKKPAKTKKANPVSKAESDGEAVDAGEVVVHRNDEGEKYLDLGRNRRATVRDFKGTILLDIREYYGSGTDTKPGKKGISLKVEEWETLKQSTAALDKLVSSMKK